MKKAIRTFMERIKRSGVKRPGVVRSVAMGREREFDAWDIGDDTFIFERGVQSHLDEHPSVLMVPKEDLRKKAPGRVMTITTGNHSVAAFPLLDGRFWKFSRLSPAKRGDVLMHCVLCANVVNDTIEISQREVPSKRLFLTDEWLLGKTCGFQMPDIVMGERNDVTLEHYRQCGQEWRVKPLAWSENDMRVALEASKKRISSKIRYYHSMKGVHFFTFPQFKRFAEFAETKLDAFKKGLHELVSVFEGNHLSFTRLPKIRGHHEIEFFGIHRGKSLEKLIPALERLMESIVLGRIDQAGIVEKMKEIVAIYESLLTKPEMADETSKIFTESLYMHITGEIYSVVSEGATPAFDDRRTALPGATYIEGRPSYHPGLDDRSEVLLSNLRGMLSKDEKIEYANVYELHGEDENVPLGKGKTREIVYKTDRTPMERSIIEKRLSMAKKGYSSYVLARIEGFKALGVSLADYRILFRRPKAGRRQVDYFTRNRLTGEPMDAIPANYFSNADDSSVEEKEVVLALAQLMGDAAAQNMAMKKYDPATMSPNYGIGKEIYEFEYDIMSGRVVPKSVSTCSIRGSFGWPCLDETDDNLQRIAAFYLSHYAHALKKYQRQHKATMLEVAERFMQGFEYRTESMAWEISVMRDKFESFRPQLPYAYHFDAKWRFILWSLERQARRLPLLRRMFFSRVALVEASSQKVEKGEAVDDDDTIELEI